MKIEINKNKKKNKSEEISREMDEELGVRLQERGKQYSVESVKTLDRLDDLKHSYESMKHQVEQIRKSTDLSDYLSVSRSKSQLAQLLGSIEKLQFNKLDAVCTVNLHSGKQVAKSNRRELNAALDALQEEVSSLYAEYDKVPRPSSSSSSSSTPSNNNSNGNSSPMASLRDVAVEIDECGSNKMECDEVADHVDGDEKCDNCSDQDDCDMKGHEMDEEDDVDGILDNVRTSDCDDITTGDETASVEVNVNDDNTAGDARRDVTPSENEKEDKSEMEISSSDNLRDDIENSNDEKMSKARRECGTWQDKARAYAVEQQRQRQMAEARRQQMLRVHMWQQELERREQERLHAFRQQEQQRRLLAMQQPQRNYRRHHPVMYADESIPLFGYY